MIKLFRNVRQRLLRENRFTRYLIYAIGEIILVVIGIMIAIQLNDRYNQKQLEKQNQVYIQKMIGDLEVTNERFDLLLNKTDTQWPSFRQAVKNADTLLKLSYKGFTKDDFEFIMNTNPFQGGSLLNVTNKTYQELLNTGKLYSLGSDSLTTAIVRYYTNVEREEVYNKLNRDEIWQGLRQSEIFFFNMKIDYQMNGDQINLNDYDNYFDPQSDEYRRLQTALIYLKEGQRINMVKIEMLKEETEDLKQQLLTALNE